MRMSTASGPSWMKCLGRTISSQCARYERRRATPVNFLAQRATSSCGIQKGEKLQRRGHFGLELPRFCGHLILWEEGVHDGEEAPTIPTGVPPAVGGARPRGEDTGVAGSAV